MNDASAAAKRSLATISTPAINAEPTSAAKTSARSLKTPTKRVQVTCRCSEKTYPHRLTKQCERWRDIGIPPHWQDVMARDVGVKREGEI